MPPFPAASGYRGDVRLAALLFLPACLNPLDRCGPGAPGASLTCPVPGEVDRAFDLHVPSSTATPLPVVIVFHGGGGNKRGAARVTCPEGSEDDPTCFVAQAVGAGFVVVAPDGTGTRLLPGIRTWNAGGGQAGYTCVSGVACHSEVDDIAYIDAVLDEVERVVVIDRTRLYATGLSNGGAMSHRLACERPLAGIAAVGGANQFVTSAPCPGPMSVLQIHGTEDPCWPYAQGAASCAGLEFEGVKIGVAESMEGWRTNNGCTATTVEEALPDLDPSDGTTTTRVTWQGCTRPTVLLRIDGGGHTWPRGWPYLGEDRVGRIAQDFDGNREILEFFGAP